MQIWMGLAFKEGYPHTIGFVYVKARKRCLYMYIHIDFVLFAGGAAAAVAAITTKIEHAPYN